MLFGIQEPVSAAVWNLLNNYCIEDAIFLSERLHAEVGSDESAFLLATCYFRNGQIIHAMHTLEKVKPPTPKCRLLLVRCYLEQKEYAGYSTHSWSLQECVLFPCVLQAGGHGAVPRGGSQAIPDGHRHSVLAGGRIPAEE